MFCHVTRAMKGVVLRSIQLARETIERAHTTTGLRIDVVRYMVCLCWLWWFRSDGSYVKSVLVACRAACLHRYKWTTRSQCVLIVPVNQSRRAERLIRASEVDNSGQPLVSDKVGDSLDVWQGQSNPPRKGCPGVLPRCYSTACRCTADFSISRTMLCHQQTSVGLRRFGSGRNARTSVLSLLPKFAVTTGSKSFGRWPLTG